jgi:hypothetical protein
VVFAKFPKNENWSIRTNSLQRRWFV